MSEPETILAHAARVLRGMDGSAGRRVVVTAGPDPRIDRSGAGGDQPLQRQDGLSRRGGRLGAGRRGRAHLRTGGARRRRSASRCAGWRRTKELEEAVRAELPAADVLVMAAAPADFRPSIPSDSKRSRNDGALAIPMEPTDDILSATRDERRPGSVIVGFALETGDALAKGRAKLERKDLDLIVVNDALEPGAGFEHDTNRVALLGRDGTPRSCRCSRSARWPRRSSTRWSRPLAD